MPKQSVLIAGCGDVGCQLGLNLQQTGLNVYGLRRNINQLASGIQGIAADLTRPDSLQALPAADIVVYIAAASRHDEAGYQAAYVDGLQNLLQALPQSPQHLFFISSTSVYHQQDHSWVDESSPTEPESFSGKLMLKAEQLALNSGIPATVVRFSGIYGPGRNHLLRQVQAGRSAPAEPALYSNRIHRDDCAGVLAHLIQRALNGLSLDSVYLASDDQPTPVHDVSQWLAQQMGVTLTDFSAGRRAGSKRCSNRQLRATGYNFIYPGYQDGYATLLSEFSAEA